MSGQLLLMAVAIWMVGFLGAIFPVVVASYNRMALALCNSFAAGVMLAAGFVHLLADSEQPLADISKRLDFPIADFVCAISFILVFYFEVIFSRSLAAGHHHMAHISVDKDEACFPTAADNRAPSIVRISKHAGYGTTHAAAEEAQPILLAEEGRKEGHHHHGPQKGHGGHHHHHGNGAGAGGHSHQHHHPAHQPHKPVVNEAPHAKGEEAHHLEADVHTLSGSLCLLAALAFHSVIEGLGLATSSTKQLGIFLAIICHKGLAAIALGSTLLVAKVTRSQFLFIITCFSLATPIGVGLGVLISEYFREGGITPGICAAVAAGTFIHISAIEIIPSAFKDSHTPAVLQLGSLTTGFLSMSLLRRWV